MPDAASRADEQLVDLMNQYERPLFNFLLAMSRDSDLALDCAQDTFLRAYQHLQRGHQINGAWLYKVGRNRTMDEFRHRRYTQTDPEVLDTIPVHESTDCVLAVQSALAELSPADREVLYLFDIAGFKTDEIGAMFGVRGSAIRQRLSRARERFRVLYGAET